MAESSGGDGNGRGPRPERPPVLEVGTVLENYVVSGLLGQGGFGVTYLARDEKLRHLVAIKEFLPENIAHREEGGRVAARSVSLEQRFEKGKERFLLEARTLAQFRHPNLIRVLTFFETNNTAYFVMDYESGESLKSILQRKERIGEEELLAIVLPLLDGLEVLHAAGFIHRDVKPGNIYVRSDGSPVLLDFGSVRRAKSVAPRRGAAHLTPGYAPVEQYFEAKGKQGPWTDLYALGAVMYKSLTGIRPVDAMARENQIAEGGEDPLSSAVGIAVGCASKRVLEGIDFAMRLKIEERPSSVAEWREFLKVEGPEEAPEGYCRIPQSPGADQALEYEGAGGLGLIEDSLSLNLTDDLRRVLILSSDMAYGREASDAVRSIQEVGLSRANAGKKGLELLIRRGCDLVLCDLCLCDMNGLDFLSRLAAEPLLGLVPVIFVSPLGKKETFLEAVAAGAWGVMLRPCSLDDFRRLVFSVLQLHYFCEIEEILLKDAREMIEAKSYNGAVEALNEILASWPGDGSESEGPGAASCFAGLKSLLAGDFNEAASFFVKSSKLDRLFKGVHKGLHLAYVGKNERERADDHLERFKIIEMSEKRRARLKEGFVRILLHESELPNPFNTLGVRLRRRGDLAEAARALKLALHAPVDESRVRFNLARVLASERKDKQALAETVKALELSPSFGEASRLHQRLTGEPWPGAEDKARKADPSVLVELLDV